MNDAVVIIPHFNDTSRLMRCLRALVPQLPETVDLVVVDNASTDSLEGIRTEFPNVRIVIETKKGAAEARNRGVLESTAPALFFLDCDCVPDPNWIETALRIKDQADVIGGRIEVFDETPAPRSGAEGFETVFAFQNRRYIEEKGFSVTANLLTRREVFEKTGPMRAGLSEDLEWCHRAQSQGFGISYAEELGVSHPTRGDWQALARKWLRLTEESFGVHKNAGRSNLSWALRGMAMPASALPHSLKVLRHGALKGSGERWAAVQTLWRLRLTRMAWMLRQSLGASL